MTETPQPPVQPAPVQPAPTLPAGTKGNGMATAGMILGIVCVATSWIWCFAWLSLGCGVVGLILSIIGRKKAQELGGIGAGKAKFGLICSVVGIAITVAVWIAVLAFLSGAKETWESTLQKAVEAYSEAQ